MTTDNNNYGFRFREWDIYKDTRKFRIEINKLLKTFPIEEKYALVDQTKRALNSMILNIAESTYKNTDKEMRTYINWAQCSLDEVVSCLDCALDDEYLTENQHRSALEKAASLAKRFKGFNRHLLVSQQSAVSSQQSAASSKVKAAQPASCSSLGSDRNGINNLRGRDYGPRTTGHPQATVCP